ncbi:MAG: prolipoprotein diacylglyceryl transferase [Dermatophilaceae bacterium]
MTSALAPPAVIPSPTTSVWWLGPVPLRAYALCILTGIAVAGWWTGRRLAARGGRPGDVLDVALWGVPVGIVGARLYHVITSPQAYFGPGGHPANALRIWDGGMGMWGGFALGGVGAWVACRRRGLSPLLFADAAAPALAVAQAIGRLGNWFNNEVYGAATDLPWGLRVYQWDAGAGHAVRDAAGEPIVKGVVHPTFLYEVLWCALLALVIVGLERARRLRPGQAIALAIAGYCLGRFVVELLRADEANRILGVRVNTWVSALVLAVGVGMYLRAGSRGSGARADATQHAAPGR